jgi:molecular chaperone DnaJ
VTEQRSGTSLFRRINPCPDCRGRGETVKEPCRACQGQGVLWETRELTIQVPAGADTGHTIRVEGEGEPGEPRPGDLYVMANVQRHPVFRRRGADIYVQKSLDFTTAALGGQVQVPTLKGDQMLDIPEGTQSGAIFRIPGEGLPYLQAAGQGDEYVIVELAVPADLSEREKEGALPESYR